MTGSWESVQFLLKKNVEIDCRSANDSTPLHLACQNGHLAIVSALILEHHADMNAQNAYGLTPLMFCSIGSVKLAMKCI